MSQIQPSQTDELSESHRTPKCRREFAYFRLTGMRANIQQILSEPELLTVTEARKLRTLVFVMDELISAWKQNNSLILGEHS